MLLPKRLGEKKVGKKKNWIIRIAGSYLSGDFKVAGTIARKAGDGSHASLEG